MIRLKDLSDKVISYHPDPSIDLIEKAYVFSAQVHKGQLRLSGEPYLTHPMEVASLLTDLKLDVVSVATGLLHDTVEDTHTTLEAIEEFFGEEIASLVDGLTKISRISFHATEEKQAENFRKMILAMAKDIRVILIKLADRLHNMRTLNFLPPEKTVELAQETLDIYAPLANRLGIFWMKSELEDLSLLYLHPEIYHSLEENIASREKETEKYVQEVIEIIKSKLKDFDVKAETQGRTKHLFSIYRKMQLQNLDFDQIYDLVGFRIMVESVRVCYETLGTIHSLWKPIPGRFKDYIAMPKANMYQSLHTTVIGPGGKRIEVQIRTQEMHHIAEQGIAAHWRYKEGKNIEKKDDEQFAWLRQLLEWQQDLKDPREFLDTVKIDLFPEEVYVFTPKGAVKQFPLGATPVDFAYSVHTEIGHHCVGARVNGKLVSLKYQLKNGDIIEIITSPQHKPSKDWMRFVKTSRAKTKINHWIKSEERSKSIELGREICEKEFRKHGLNFSKLSKKEDMGRYLTELKLKNEEELFVLVGYGRISAKQLVNKFVPPEELEKKARAESRIKKVARRLIGKSESGVIVKEIDNIMVRFGKCCNPLPGEKIKGYITRGRGVTIHSYNCIYIQGCDQARLIDVKWDQREKFVYPVKIEVTSVDKRGLLAAISSSISLAEANISNAYARTLGDQKAVSTFELGVNDLEHLRNVIKSVEKIKGVIKVSRLNV
ncbi:MAG: bifunctional (p)ppGpp synthetase/guanosine-3',5'-bis(diphosphate) 3'-pyrophosphohydrolase [Thermodesulfobacteriota bacterium]|nr:bifunctional (p)ppGpp synthetase/guanosine-3',5'-bis(diphosphate) 3'-pyrophosphohydrolase [Deltaproteobacteria bacterium]